MGIGIGIGDDAGMVAALVGTSAHEGAPQPGGWSSVASGREDHGAVGKDSGKRLTTHAYRAMNSRTSSTVPKQM